MTHIIEESKIQKRNENGGLFKQTIFEENNVKFKYVIQTDTYDFQAHAKLYAWTKDKGFSLVISKPLVESYGSNPTSYSPHGISKEEKDFFLVVSKDMTDIAKKFSS